MSDINAHVDDATIEEAIKSNDDIDHPDALTVDEVRELLDWLQEGVEYRWGEWAHNIEHGDIEVVTEDSDTIVMSTGPHNIVSEELDHYDGDVEVDGIAQSIVTQIHHELARERCDHSWSVSYPYVVTKPESFEAGRQFVEAVVNSLQRKGLSPGQAWAYYGVEIKGSSMNRWGRRKGDHDHKNVSDALEKARQKLP